MARWFSERFLGNSLDPEKWDQVVDIAASSTTAITNSAVELRPSAGSWVHLVSRMEQPLNQFISGTVRLTSTVGALRAFVAACSNGDRPSGAEDRIFKGYTLQFEHDGTVSIRKHVAGTETVLATTSVAMTAGTLYRFQFEVLTGTAVRAKVWADGGATPGSWTVTGTTDSAITAGVLELGSYRSASGTGFAQFGSILVTTSSVPTTSAPSIFRNNDGSIKRHGRSWMRKVDDCWDSTQPSWMTGTTSYASTAHTRRIDMAGNATTTVTMAPIGMSNKIVWVGFTLENMRMNASTAVGYELQLVGNVNTYKLWQDASFNAARLAIGATNTDIQFYRTITNGEATRHRNISFVILPQKGELLAFQDDQLIGFVRTSVLTDTTLTPTLVGKATSASARELSWSSLKLEVDRL